MGRLRHAAIAVTAAGIAALLVGWLPLSLVPAGDLRLLIGAIALVLLGGVVVPFVAARAGAYRGRGMPLFGLIGLVLIVAAGIHVGLSLAGAESDDVSLVLGLAAIGSVLGHLTVVLEREAGHTTSPR